MMNMPVKKGCVWVDLGGGTASNVEFFGKSVMTDWFKSVHVVDLTPSLVRVAKKRVEDNNWGGKVSIGPSPATETPAGPPSLTTRSPPSPSVPLSPCPSPLCNPAKVNIILGDATDPNLEGLPPSGSCDVVSISYAVTMIPNWRDVLKNAHRLLKPGGHICVCDFTVDRVSRHRLPHLPRLPPSLTPLFTLSAPCDPGLSVGHQQDLLEVPVQHGPHLPERGAHRNTSVDV